MNRINPVNQQPDQPTPVPQVSNQLILLAQEIKDNDAIIGALRAKLQPVLQPVPEAAQCGAKPEEYIVPLAAELRTLLQAARAQNIELRTIVEGIEL